MSHDDFDHDRTVAGDDLDEALDGLDDTGAVSDNGVAPDSQSAWTDAAPPGPAAANDPFDEDRTLAGDTSWAAVEGKPTGGAEAGGDRAASRGTGPPPTSGPSPSGIGPMPGGSGDGGGPPRGRQPTNGPAPTQWKPGQRPGSEAAPGDTPDGRVGMDRTDHTMAAPADHPSQLTDPVLGRAGQDGTASAGRATGGGSGGGAGGRWTPPASSRSRSEPVEDGGRRLPAWLIPVVATVVVAIVLLVLLVSS